MRRRSDKDAILSLYLYGKVPEGGGPLDHLKKFDTCRFLPVFWEVSRSEFGHKRGKIESKQVVTVDTDPILNTRVTKACENLSDLFVLYNVFRVEVTITGLFVCSHDSGGNISRLQKRNFGWGVLDDDGKSGLRRHGAYTGSRAVRGGG